MNAKCTECDADAHYIRGGNTLCFSCNQALRNEDRQTVRERPEMMWEISNTAYEKGKKDDAGG